MNYSSQGSLSGDHRAGSLLFHVSLPTKCCLTAFSSSKQFFYFPHFLWLLFHEYLAPSGLMMASLFESCANGQFASNKSIKTTNISTTQFPEILIAHSLVSYILFSVCCLADLFVMLRYLHERVVGSTWSRTKLFEVGDIWEPKLDRMFTADTSEIRAKFI